MMKEEDVFYCEQLCREFLRRAKAWRNVKNEPEKHGRITANAEHAALYRLSLDLWRALAFLRRRNNG